MSHEAPTYEQRERRYRDADALVYCPDCGRSHAATREDEDYRNACPNQ